MPVISYACILFSIINYVRFSSVARTDGTEAAAIECGAVYTPNIAELHQYWRFLSAGFVHFSIWHLLMNIYVMWSLGTSVENLLGHVQFGILFFGAVILGNIFVYLLNRGTVTGGLSGGLYGLLAMYLTLVIHRSGFAGIFANSSLLYNICINLLINFMPGVSWQSHAGGACFGIFYTILLMRINGTY